MPSEGTKVTLTLEGSITGDVEVGVEGLRGTEPVAARMRPQLLCHNKVRI